jgi:very-short-patch-repair endonuclease
MTDAEQLLWFHVRRKQLLGIQFYRQKPVGPFIVDFYAPAVKLVLELDGSQHFEGEHARRDAQRNAALAELGLCVMRFDNLQVLTETEAVLEEIHRVCKERIVL